VAALPGTSAVATGPSYACTELPLLSYYQAAGAVLEQSPNHLKLHLLIDLHGLDCGAPDATGHHLEVNLAVEGEGEHCWVRGGSVKATPFGLEYAAQKAWQDELRPDEAVDLAAVDPSDAVLRAVTTPRALILTPGGYWLFEDVKPGAPLHPRLPGEDEQGCCYGFTAGSTTTPRGSPLPRLPATKPSERASTLGRLTAVCVIGSRCSFAGRLISGQVTGSQSSFPTRGIPWRRRCG
jgi:hypothetical protein